MESNRPIPHAFYLLSFGSAYYYKSGFAPKTSLRGNPCTNHEQVNLRLKNLHCTGTNELQEVNYNCTIRGWLTGINNPNSLGNDHFGMALGYTSGDEPQHNGNISEMYWKTGGFNLCEYQFDYDVANRLTNAVYTGTGQVN